MGWRHGGLVVLCGLLVAAAVAGIVGADRDPTSASPATSAMHAAHVPDPLQVRANSALTGLPLTFVRNRGQVDTRVDYYAERGGASLFFTTDGLTIAQLGSRSGRWSVKVAFPGADRVRPEGIDPAPGVVSYFRGPPSDWQTGLLTFHGVVYRDLWPGIDLAYRGTPGGSLEYSLLVHPGADPGSIRLAYQGITESTLASDGALHLVTPAGEMVDRAPVAYQDIDGRRVPVPAAYRLAGPGSADPVAGFSLGRYETSRPLVIDPNLIYSGFIGGTGTDLAWSVAVDSTGNAYVAGWTNSNQSSFPVTVGPDLTYNDSGSSFDAFVSKVNPAGTALLYSGYIGGNKQDQAFGIAVDATGAAYVVGETTSAAATFPETVGPDLVKGAGNETDARDEFIAKVNPSGTGLVYAGYVGGNDYDTGGKVAVDSQGDAYVVGVTESSIAEGFPAVNGPDIGYNGDLDAFVGKVRADGTGFSYLGYIGGTDLDSAGGVDVDPQGNAYVVGYTWSDASELFPLVGGGDSTLDGFQDAFISKVAPTGAGFVYSRYVGGVGSFDEDSASGVVVDVAGDAFIAGQTDADETTFPVVDGPDTTYNGGLDAFVAELAPDSLGFEFSGYIGGSGSEFAGGIALDSSGNAYIAGVTGSDETTFPVTLLPDLTYNGNGDAFVAEVAKGGIGLVYAGYVGGSGDDYALDNAVIPGNGRQVIVGRTTGGTFPKVVGPDVSFNGNGPPLGFDGFVTKIFASGDTDMKISKTGPLKASVGQIITYTLTVANQGPNTALNVVVVDTLASQVVFDSATTTQGVCNLLTPSKVHCAVGDMAVGQVVTIKIDVKCAMSGTALDTAIAKSKTPDPLTPNNGAQWRTEIAPS